MVASVGSATVRSSMLQPYNTNVSNDAITPIDDDLGRHDDKDKFATPTLMDDKKKGPSDFSNNDDETSAIISAIIPDLNMLERAPTSPSSPSSLPTSSYPSVPPNHTPPILQSSIVLLLNFLLNMTFFIIVPTSAAYANDLGASTWFSGLTIGISTLIAGMFLVPFSKRYTRVYRFPVLFSSICILVGEVIYALAGLAGTAWMMFLGRVVLGAGFVSWKYVKEYFTDAAVVGVSKRTMMSACLVTTQVGGMAVGPFVGGLLSKHVRPMTADTKVWNGFTASGWLMAGIFGLFFLLSFFFFQDPIIPQSPPSSSSPAASSSNASAMVVELRPLPPFLPPSHPSSTAKESSLKETRQQERQSEPTIRTMLRELNSTQKFSVATMCWFSMVNFLVLGAWEANIPLFGRLRFDWSEYNAGNVIALGGLATMPILFTLVFVARHIQDRLILASGLLLGLLGLSLHLGSLENPTISSVANLPTLNRLNFGNFFTSWFLVALGYNMLTTITLSLLSKQIPAKYNGLTSTVIQLSNYSGRISGALWGSTIFLVGQWGIVALELAVTLIGACLVGFMWRKMDVARG